ncbi:MAG: hypothetical protein Q4F57_00620 [Weeksellaceae bacterium]|nr:hypothetical protein [Weeksellaceae bacterium]
MKHFVFVVFFLGMLAGASAKNFVRAEIDYVNGTSESVYVGFPISVDSRKISLRSSENGKITKIDAENVRMITVNSNDGLAHLIYSKYKYYLSNMKEKTSKSKAWFLKSGECGDLSLYLDATEYRMKKNSMMAYFASPNSQAYYLHLKKASEEEVTQVALNRSVGPMVAIMANKYFRDCSKEYFSDRPDLVEKIGAKHYNGDVVQLMKDYCGIEE